MFNPANQTHFSLSLDGLRHDLQVLEFSGHEGISRPYRFELELVSERAGPTSGSSSTSRCRRSSP